MFESWIIPGLLPEQQPHCLISLYRGTKHPTPYVTYLDCSQSSSHTVLYHCTGEPIIPRHMSHTWIVPRAAATLSYITVQGNQTSHAICHIPGLLPEQQPHCLISLYRGTKHPTPYVTYLDCSQSSSHTVLYHCTGEQSIPRHMSHTWIVPRAAATLYYITVQGNQAHCIISLYITISPFCKGNIEMHFLQAKWLYF